MGDGGAGVSSVGDVASSAAGDRGEDAPTESARLVRDMPDLALLPDFTDAASDFSAT